MGLLDNPVLTGLLGGTQGNVRGLEQLRAQLLSGQGATGRPPAVSGPPSPIVTRDTSGESFARGAAQFATGMGGVADAIKAARHREALLQLIEGLPEGGGGVAMPAASTGGAASMPPRPRGETGLAASDGTPISRAEMVIAANSGQGSSMTTGQARGLAAANPSIPTTPDGRPIEAQRQGSGGLTRGLARNLVEAGYGDQVVQALLRRESPADLRQVYNTGTKQPGFATDAEIRASSGGLVPIGAMPTERPLTASSFVNMHNPAGGGKPRNIQVGTPEHASLVAAGWVEGMPPKPAADSDGGQWAYDRDAGRAARVTAADLRARPDRYGPLSEIPKPETEHWATDRETGQAGLFPVSTLKADPKRYGPAAEASDGGRYRQRRRPISDAQEVFEESRDGGRTWERVGNPFARSQDPTAAVLRALFDPNGAGDPKGAETVPAAGAGGAPPAPGPAGGPTAEQVEATLQSAREVLRANPAKRQEVEKRLRDNGIDPALLGGGGYQ